MKSMLCRRKVLVLLDDVDKLGQLEALAGKHNWFGSGNRIIITTRDQHLLRTHKVDHVYPIRLLSNDEAIQLLKRHANNEQDPIVDYETLSSRVISYASGLPLALRKELFLDIACFWRFRRPDDAMEILETCGYHPETGIKEMGHYIVRGEHPKNPKEHSIVWKREEIKEMCFGDATMENDKTEAITYFVNRADDHDLSSRFCKIVSNMKKLRWLKVTTDDDVKGDRGPNFLSNELKYIDWVGYPTTSPFPDSFQPINLVVLKLRNSKQKELWKGCKYLPQLKVLQLEEMKKLLSTPDFHGLPRLQKLTLESCYELEEIHPSFGNHTSLEFLNGKAIENGSMLLLLPGLEIAMGFTPPLLRGSRYTLQLPESWCDDFSGFLMCAVSKYYFISRDFLKISVKQELSGLDSKDDVVWEESDGDENTLVWYVSFGSLRCTAWWDQTYKALSFENADDRCSGFGVRKVEVV
ncbi:hypothetical protein L1987_30878 [Smallanthus sonchifolius]|uniref:Uncharacterized protein n=1 Tax=Smallanthus sonchifolius TaxID=185202 RepID=A0ACB9I6Q4_9ASTR|nr:hypothetical protein L1987_30878 [Smallanthus sonchifolius]